MAKRKPKQEPEVTKLTEHMQQSHPLWSAFCVWCSENDVDMEYAEDWAEWWNCYLSGAEDGLVAFELHLKANKHG